jgi:predicted enzyme related to lactoylglutathione lyase
MAGPAAWIDITATDARRSRDFYAGLFEWPIDVVEEIDYGVVAPGAERLPLGRATALGPSTAVERWEVPAMGTTAVVLDPDGTRVGLWTPAS